ncbi:D-isomer specific 2-hydroxyacid dehydrogenase [Tothia fuscella]|uniref:D-isomer specific 2-hydroxyacid dehydrogenase n=1 Tax=Tothia fuscella TaxID=1048955 RepID=A0A9P4TSR1_9PEZI|nr:D-isomer specific 2-hydroxyacid dehydrogenase [Tothia fuscella]
MPPIKLAILDDYQGIAQQHFQAIDPSIEITSFPETLHPSHNDGDLEKLVERLKDFNVISTMRERTPFQAPLLRQLPDLRLILTTGLRNAALDVKTCSELGIQVCGTDARHNLPKSNPKYPVPDSTTTHCWALILALSRHIARDDRLIKEGAWQGPTLSTRIQGRVLGLAGLGRLGASVGRIAIQAWGMQVICWSTNLTQEKADEQANGSGLDPGDFKAVSKDQLFSDADVVSVQLVLSERSKGIIGREDLQRMKKTALFVNTSRGPLVDESALLEVCEKGIIAGAALDVYVQEPLAKDSKWRTTKWGTDGRAEVVLAPHMGYGEIESMTNWYKENAENLGRYVRGEELTAKLSADANNAYKA